MERTLYKQERINQILSLLHEKESVSVVALAEHFGVSGATIRTDLTEMENMGLVHRTHGGVMLGTGYAMFESPMDERLHRDEKRLIGEAAVKLIDSGDTILIDTGSTMTAFAEALAKCPIEDLIIYSIDLDVIRILEHRRTYELHIIGGRVRNGFHYCEEGSITSRLLEYRFNKLFLGSPAVSLDFGLSVANSDLAHIKKSMIRVAARTILLADASKMNVQHLHRFATLSDIDTLIMNDALSREQADLLRAQIPDVKLV